MKKIVSIFVLSLYFALTAVEVVAIHFCHGRLESVSLSEPEGPCCQGMHTVNPSCCEDLIIEIDFDSDHISSERIILPEYPILSPLSQLFFNSLELSPGKGEPVLLCKTDNAPPPAKLYRVYSSFIFYG